MTLELDHIFCMVADLDEAAATLERDGWVLDAGTLHSGQGTRNRRLPWSAQYLELLSVTDRHEAIASPLRMDRRADWETTGASPFGVGFRGLLPERCQDRFWLYEELGIRIWIHTDNEHRPERPLVFVLELSDQAIDSRRARAGGLDRLAAQRRSALVEVRLSGPEAVSLPGYDGPPIEQTGGPPHLELVVARGVCGRQITRLLTIRG